MTDEAARCEWCGHTYFQHLGGSCSGRIVFDDVLDEGGVCGCDDFHEDDFDYDDEEFEDDEGIECPGCGDLVEALNDDDLCQGCAIAGPPRPVVTITPSPTFL